MTADHPLCDNAASVAMNDGVPLVSRVVVRYRDGRMLKGFTREFLASRGIAEVWPVANGTSANPMTVPFGHLKAIFFVRDFDGNASYVTGRASATTPRGRKVAVTFLDGEELTGVTLSYQAGGVGFFVHPLDDQDNNMRVFVVSQSIRHVQFL
jgi:hypothetical protein